MRISCIIVEDEPLALERTRSYVEKLPFLHLLATFDNGIDALAFLKTNKTDLIFLDINMGEFSGLQLLESANIKSEVIITTAYQEHAIKGFELNVTDYLLKPFTFDRFVKAVERVKVQSSENVDARNQIIFIKTEHRLEKYHLSEILYIEGMRDYRKVHTLSKKIMTLQTFGDFETEVPARFLCRVHKSFMVAPARIDSIEKDRIRIGEAFIPISETYRKRFFEVINYQGK